jgi:hypothetical protein
MATYKVIQNIEAEDKLLGPLTLRQFVYAVVVVVLGFIAFRLLFILPWAILFLLPPMIFFAVLAAPFGHDQPSEVWLLAKIRFALKPRRRIWDQSGVKELVTITAPKTIEKQLTKNFTQSEVRSRLQALANTIDSRGWAVKNVNVNLYNQPAYATQGITDRLIDMDQMAKEVPAYDLQPTDDIFDEVTSPTAQHFNQLMAKSTQTHRQHILQEMQQASAPTQTQQNQQQGQPAPDYWFLNEPIEKPQIDPNYAVFNKSTVVQPDQPLNDFVALPQSGNPTQEEQAILEHIQKKKSQPDPMHSHLKTILPLAEQEKLKAEEARKKAQEAAQKKSKPQHPTTSVAPVDPVILELSRNNDLNLETVSRQAKKGREQPPQDEVIVKLH